MTLKFNPDIGMMVHHEAEMKDGEIPILENSVWGFSKFRAIEMPCAYSRKVQRKFFVFSHLMDSFLKRWKRRSLYDKLKAIDAVMGLDILYYTSNIVSHFKMMGVKCPSLCRLVSEDISNKLCDLYDEWISQCKVIAQSDKLLETEKQLSVEEDSYMPSMSRALKSVSASISQPSAEVYDKQESDWSQSMSSSQEDDIMVYELCCQNKNSLVGMPDISNQSAENITNNNCPSYSLYQSARFMPSPSGKLSSNAPRDSTETQQQLLTPSNQIDWNFVTLSDHTQSEPQSVTPIDHPRCHQPFVPSSDHSGQHHFTFSREFEFYRFNDGLSAQDRPGTSSTVHQKEQGNIQSSSGAVSGIIVEKNFLFQWLEECHLKELSQLDTSLEQLEHANYMNIQISEGNNSIGFTNREIKFRNLLKEAEEELNNHNEVYGITTVALTGSPSLLETISSKLVHYSQASSQMSAIYKVSGMEGECCSSDSPNNGKSPLNRLGQSSEGLSGQSGLKLWLVKDIQPSATKEDQMSETGDYTCDRICVTVIESHTDFTVNLCKEIENHANSPYKAGSAACSSVDVTQEGSGCSEAGWAEKLNCGQALGTYSPRLLKKAADRFPVVSPLLISKVIKGNQTNYKITRVSRKKKFGSLKNRVHAKGNAAHSVDLEPYVLLSPLPQINSTMSAEEALNVLPEDPILTQGKRKHTDVPDEIDNHNYSNKKMPEENKRHYADESGESCDEVCSDKTSLENQHGSEDNRGPWNQHGDFPLQETIVMMSEDFINNPKKADIDDDQPIDLSMSNKMNIIPINERGECLDIENLSVMDRAHVMLSGTQSAMDEVAADLTHHVSVLLDSLKELLQEVSKARRERIELQSKLSGLKRSWILQV